LKVWAHGEPQNKIIKSKGCCTVAWPLGTNWFKVGEVQALEIDVHMICACGFWAIVILNNAGVSVKKTLKKMEYVGVHSKQNWDQLSGKLLEVQIMIAEC